MATIKVCDRCGAKITPSISGDQRIIFEGSVWSLLVPTRAMDLCESCAQELREWMKPKVAEFGEEDGND